MMVPSSLKALFCKVLLGCIAAVCVTGCSTVQPWERGNLADYTMRPDRDPLSVKGREHIYFSRESPYGGGGVGGGGCGCN